MQTEQSILDRIQRRQNGMDTSLEWKIVVGQIRFTSEHSTEGEEEDSNNHGRTKRSTSWEAETI